MARISQAAVRINIKTRGKPHSSVMLASNWHCIYVYEHQLLDLTLTNRILHLMKGGEISYIYIYRYNPIQVN